VNLYDEILSDPDRAPLPAGPRELPDVTAAILELAAVGGPEELAAAERYGDRVRSLYVGGGWSRVGRALSAAKER
jgi:hypothetical protein